MNANTIVSRSDLLVVRPMDTTETAMVLSSWKKELFDKKPTTRWAKELRDVEFWALLNHVIDRLVMPRSKVWIGASPAHPTVPMFWAVVRFTEQIIFLYHRRGLEKDMKLAPGELATLETDFLNQIPSGAAFATFNPFMELL